MNDLKNLPLIQGATRAQSESIETTVGRLNNGRIIIPDYQRNAEQWDLAKESLFIESILNNLTIPAFFFDKPTEGPVEVVDGQQRLQAILKYESDGFALSDDAGLAYLVPDSVHYRGKKFSQLPRKLQEVFYDYPLAIIYLPERLELGTKLEIFRRINEGGTPLTAHDIRLAYYSESRAVTFVRLAGVYMDTQATHRMIESAGDKGVENPWTKHPKTFDLWKQWWEGKAQARGQTPSEMFLWYLISRNRNQLNRMLDSPEAHKHLPLAFRGSTEEALDIFCAQLKFDETEGRVKIFDFNGQMSGYFDQYVAFVDAILGSGFPGISVDKYKQIALLIAALSELEKSPEEIGNDQWDALSEFIRQPRKTGKEWLDNGYPEQKGRWGGTSGQFAQCESVVKLAKRIMDSK